MTQFALSQTDLSYGDAYLRQQCAVATFPFLTSTENDFTQPFVIKSIGQRTIAFVADTDQEQAISQANVVVALGNVEASKHIDVAIQPDETETTESDSGTLYVGSKSEGKTLGLLALWIDANGELTHHYATQLALTGDVEESESVRQLLTDFYREISQLSDTTPLFANQHLEQNHQNGYVSATACQRCHQQEYLQWSATRHAFAFETLVKKERYFDAGCVSCHTTGFGYPTGFQIDAQDSALKGVQCETCPRSRQTARRQPEKEQHP